MKRHMSHNKTDQRYPTLSSNRDLMARSSRLVKRGLALVEAMPSIPTRFQQRPAATTYDIYNQSILLVDDVKAVREILTEELEDAGFTNIIHADRASKAIEILQELGDRVVLVITHNIGVERGHEEGREMVKYLSNTYKGTLGVIFHTPCTTYADEAMALGNENVVVLDYVIASYDCTRLIESVKKHLQFVMEKRGRFNEDLSLPL